MAHATTDPYLLGGALERAASTSAYSNLSGRDIATFLRLPVTEKKLLREAPGRFMVPDVRGPALRVQTSGSAGTPVPVYRSSAEFDGNAHAVAERWAGLLTPGQHRVVSLLDHNAVAAGPLVERVAMSIGGVLARAYPYAASGPRYEAVGALFEEFRPDVVVGTPGEIVDIEDAWRRAGDFERVRTSVHAVLLLGAPATSGMRRRIASSWNSAVYDASYGSTEVGTIATGCADGHLHVLSKRFVLEVRTDEVSGALTPLVAGVAGELIVTPLHTLSMALVRYASGDRVSAFECPCGTDGLALRVLGRDDDVLFVGESRLGPEEIEGLIFADPSVQDYHLACSRDWQLHTVYLQPFPGQAEAVDVTAITAVWPIAVEVVARTPIYARSGGAVKSWRRTRAMRRSRDDL